MIITPEIREAERLNYKGGAQQAEELRLHKAWARQFGRRHRPFLRNGCLYKVGYLSHDFRDHAVSLLFEGSFRHLKLHSTMFYTSKRVDDTTKRLQGLADRWVDASGMSPRGLADAIRKEGIDMLVDLGGHTSNNSLEVFARRPAPAQVSYIGYPNTTGLDCIDARIVDEVTDPEGQDKFYTEKLVRLPRCFLTFTVPEKPVPSFRQDPKGIVFGAFCKAIKITPEMINTWAQILMRVPNSTLLLRDFEYLQPGVVDSVKKYFSDAGLDDTDRVRFSSGVPREKHLLEHNLVDVILDPYPYNGTCMTMEALYMGVPVVTLAGQAHRSRVGASLLYAVGCPDLVCYNRDDYVSTAVRTAWESRAKYRPFLRDAFLDSELCDHKGLAECLEDAYHNIWRDLQARTCNVPCQEVS